LSFSKAEQLIALATLAAARHAGITLDDVVDRFQVSKRTAQRMLRALETQFPDALTSLDDEGRKRWRLPSAPLRDLMTLTPEELAALDLAIETLKRSGVTVEAEELLGLREKILALVPRSKAARLETDHEVLLEAQGLAARPGPRQRIDRKIAAAIAEAIKANRMLEVSYQARGEHHPRNRCLAPYGLLTGIRRYLVARPDDDLNGQARLYVVENIKSASVKPRAFIRDPSFNLQAFGAWYNPPHSKEALEHSASSASEYDEIADREPNSA
jgi:predicted DNA-binding transcriptional regulator YafY